MGDDHGGPVHSGDDGGDGEGFPGAGDAEEGLALEFVLESVDELRDGPRLVAGGGERCGEFKSAGGGRGGGFFFEGHGGIIGEFDFGGDFVA